MFRRSRFLVSIQSLISLSSSVHGNRGFMSFSSLKMVRLTVLLDLIFCIMRPMQINPCFFSLIAIRGRRSQ
uniref:Uncharacterized protein n=1 Tax=Cannabis sativa TaxID=3483 RepID=A0A803QXW6_CANSA